MSKGALLRTSFLRVPLSKSDLPLHPSHVGADDKEGCSGIGLDTLARSAVAAGADAGADVEAALEAGLAAEHPLLATVHAESRRRRELLRSRLPLVTAGTLPRSREHFKLAVGGAMAQPHRVVGELLQDARFAIAPSILRNRRSDPVSNCGLVLSHVKIEHNIILVA